MTNQFIECVVCGDMVLGKSPDGYVTAEDFRAERAENERLRAELDGYRKMALLREQEANALRHADEPLAGILENKLSQDQMQALFTGNGAPGREHHDPTCIKFFGVFSPLPCPCKRPAERITVAPQD